MAIQKLDRSEWAAFFDCLTRSLVGRRAQVEVASRALGSQMVASGLPFLGIVYDPRDDVIEITLEGFDHRVPRPQEFYVDDPPFQCATLGLIDGDDVLRIVKLCDPLMIPPRFD